ncbi:MAG: hypothetical protein HYZ31_07695 [Gammaproteobacteria bacterium]|jgi:hypothetical protein|nr:hypothetical protein [Gammaproteobacteria bacterium]
MRTFESNKLLSRLRLLSPERQASFALACAERLQPYREFSDDPNAMMLVRNVLDTAFDCISGNTASLERLRSLSAVLEEAPYLDDDAAASAAYVARCLLSGKAENAVWAAQRGYDARDREAQTQVEGDTITTADENRILSYPSVQEELERQMSDLDTLEGSANDVATVALRARNDANA